LQFTRDARCFQGLTLDDEWEMLDLSCNFPEICDISEHSREIGRSIKQVDFSRHSCAVCTLVRTSRMEPF
jgi:hypothetical protein